uniref:Uncharacterized protein n=1 Tax=Parascaris equorum TaxID=6256 RepID=A0A914RQH2_PAREQ
MPIPRLAQAPSRIDRLIVDFFRLLVHYVANRIEEFLTLEIFRQREEQLMEPNSSWDDIVKQFFSGFPYQISSLEIHQAPIGNSFLSEI